MSIYDRARFLRMDFSKIQDHLEIDMVRTSQGCPEQCAHCGAYPNGFRTQDLRVSEVPIDELAHMLMRRIEGSEKCIKDWLASDVTTDVNTEPLQTKNFTDFAQLIHDITQGHSRVIMISHGVRQGIRTMRDRLESIIDLMRRDIVRNFILTMDSQRLRGNIDPKKNEDSYIETMERLKPALLFPNTRITVSLQGTPYREQAQSITSVEEMYARIRQRLLEELQWNETLLKKIHEDRRSSYTKIGRASTLISPSEEAPCDVIPDTMLVRSLRSKGTTKYRGRIDGFRRILEVQLLRAGMTYGDTVDSKRWETVLAFDE